MFCENSYGFNALTISAKHSNLSVWQCSKYVSERTSILNPSSSFWTQPLKVNVWKADNYLLLRYMTCSLMDFLGKKSYFPELRSFRSLGHPISIWLKEYGWNITSCITSWIELSSLFKVDIRKIKMYKLQIWRCDLLIKVQQSKIKQNWRIWKRTK